MPFHRAPLRRLALATLLVALPGTAVAQTHDDPAERRRFPGIERVLERFRGPRPTPAPAPSAPAATILSSALSLAPWQPGFIILVPRPAPTIAELLGVRPDPARGWFTQLMSRRAPPAAPAPRRARRPRPSSPVRDALERAGFQPTWGR